MHSSGMTAVGGVGSGFLSLQTVRGWTQEAPGGHPIQTANGPTLPLHPAFQLHGYPFYPGGLLAAIRHPAQIQKQQPARDTSGAKSSGSGTKSFTIDAILADSKDNESSSREGTPPDNDPDDKMLRIPDLTRVNMPGSGRADVLHLHPQHSPYNGHTQGLGHCPPTIRYTNFNPNSRPEKKHSHVTGNTWKGKSKRVRTIFTPEQLERLEAEFERQQYMVGTERYYLAASLNLTEAQVKVWFQNRRIKWRKQNLEQQHAKMANFDLFASEDGSESDTDVIGDRKYEDAQAGDVTKKEDDVSGETANKNASFDSGISVDRPKVAGEQANAACLHQGQSRDVDELTAES